MKVLTSAELERNAQIAYNLKRLRAERRLSQRDMAQAIGISQSLLAMLESGARTLTVPMGIDIAKLFGCNVNDIIGEY